MMFVDDKWWLKMMLIDDDDDDDDDDNDDNVKWWLYMYVFIDISMYVFIISFYRHIDYSI
jgi:hypothetical protein